MSDDDDEMEDLEKFKQLLAKKKKKKTDKKTQEPAAIVDDTLGAPVEKGDPWAGTDRDYTYTEMLGRVFDLLREKNPNLSVRKRHKMPPPNLVKVGTKKIMWTNFAPSCAAMHRATTHVEKFVFAELGTEGSVDGNQRLIIKGRYVAKQIESLLKKYIIEYVTCHMCKNPETTLTRDPVTRLYFVQCESCGSRRSVAPIRTGFHATNRTDRRAARA
eukprot:gb/GEZN01013513.1/.p1 GENE.gb/GEZN01013513.1/~~gb/GEZN01013513.1/.p1  ORF type:complete len:216 (-),score=30.03 gb/GEZN01013513.1/:268-915(-)